jgi:Cu(I)-responsive transcriptional regulator
MPPAARRDSGYRDYDERDVHTLRFIGRARDLGFSIEEIRRLLELWQDRSRASHDVKELALARAAELKRKEHELHEMRRSLEHLAASCHGDERPNCPIIGGLEGAKA